MKTLAEKIAVMQAADNGEMIQEENNGHWYDVTPFWDWQHYDYRIKEAPIVAPEGFELMPEDSKEQVRESWMCSIGDGTWYTVLGDHNVAKKHGYVALIYARPIAKREPRMPDAPVFWVRSIPNISTIWMPIMISAQIIAVSDRCHTGNTLNMIDLKTWQWSADRKTWFDFYGDEIK